MPFEDAVLGGKAASHPREFSSAPSEGPESKAEDHFEPGERSSTRPKAELIGAKSASNSVEGSFSYVKEPLTAGEEPLTAAEDPRTGAATGRVEDEELSNPSEEGSSRREEALSGDRSSRARSTRRTKPK